MSALRKLASQTVLYGFTYFAGRLLNFFLTPYYTRIFDPQEFGTISLIYAFITFFNILYTYGMETGYFYFSNSRSAEDNVAGTSFSSLLYSSLLFSGILVVFAQPLASLIGYPGQPQYVVYAGLILAFDTLAVIPFAWLRKHDRAVRFALLKFVNIALNIFFNFFFLAFCPYVLNTPAMAWLQPAVRLIYQADHTVYYVFISNVLSSLLIMLLLLSEYRQIRLKWNREIWQSMLKYAWPLLILGFAGMVNETLDRILLRARLPLPADEALAQVGIYSAVYKLSIFMTLAITSFRYAAEPFFFARMKDADSKALYARVLKYFSFVTGLIFLGVLFFLPVVTQILGRNFRQGLEVVPILLMANLFLGLFYYLSQWYKQTNRTIYGAAVSLGGAAITLVINYIFIPEYGYMASAWATFCAYLFMAVISWALGQRFYPVKYQTGRILFYIASAAGLYKLSQLISDRPLGQFSLGMYMINIIFLLLYMVAFLYLERPAFLFNYVEKLKRDD